EALRVELRAEQRITEQDRADVPRVKEGKRALLACAAGFGAFGLVLLAFSFWEFQTQKVGSADDVVTGLGLPLVGTLPVLPPRARRKLSGPGAGIDPDWEGVLIEAIEATRTMLLHASGEGPAQVLMVASAASSEGKTTLACYLAGSLARTGRRTLLI